MHGALQSRSYTKMAATLKSASLALTRLSLHMSMLIFMAARVLTSN